MRPVKKKNSARTKRLMIPVSTDEIDVIDKLSIMYECDSRSEYIRKTALGKIIVDVTKLDKK